MARAEVPATAKCWLCNASYIGDRLEVDRIYGIFKSFSILDVSDFHIRFSPGDLSQHPTVSDRLQRLRWFAWPEPFDWLVENGTSRSCIVIFPNIVGYIEYV